MGALKKVYPLSIVLPTVYNDYEKKPYILDFTQQKVKLEHIF